MHHGGYESEMGGRGQPPLAFYLRALSHSLALDPTPPQPAPLAAAAAAGPPSPAPASSELLLVSSPDWANPVLL